MNVNTCYQLIQYACNKNQAGYVSPEQFNLVINQASYSYLDYLLGEFQQYIPGRSQPRVGYSQNETVRNRLTPLIYGYILNVDSSGYCPYPGDYQQVDAINTMYGNSRIRFVGQERLWSTVNSSIDPVETNPIYLIKDIGFQFYPISISQTRLSYVRTPVTIVWGYTLDGNNRPVYNASTSVDPEWYDTDMLEVIVRALRIIGVNLQSNVVSQYANEIKTNGQ